MANDEEVEDQDQPRNHNRDEEPYGKYKFQMPKFAGESDPEVYLSWQLKVDKIFRMNNYTQERKVALACLEFEEYASLWWEQLQNARQDRNEPPIATWEEMKRHLHSRFVPSHYTRDLFTKLQKITQGFKSVEEYFKEMELAMI